jgi:rhomboid protease GluP
LIEKGPEERYSNSMNEYGYSEEPYNSESYKELMNKRQKANSIVLKTDKVWLTYVLISINVVVWLFIKLYANYKGVFEGSLLTVFGAKDNTLIMSGQYWRFLTPVFLHNDITHLLVNSYSLYILGTTVEKLIGRPRFLFTYIIAGITGSIMSFMFSTYRAVGASGAIFGLLGVLIYYGIENPELFRRGFGRSILITITINLVYGFSVTGIDNFGHIGGLIGGFLAAGVVGITDFFKRLKLRVAFILITLVVVVLSLYYGFNNSQNRLMLQVDMMERMIEQQKWEEVERIGEEIIKSGTKDEFILSNSLWYLSISEISQDKSDEAIEHASALVEVDPPNGHYLLGRLYIYAGEVELARKHLKEAVKIEPKLRSEVEEILDLLETNEN